MSTRNRRIAINMNFCPFCAFQEDDIEFIRGAKR